VGWDAIAIPVPQDVGGGGQECKDATEKAAGTDHFPESLLHCNKL